MRRTEPKQTGGASGPQHPRASALPTTPTDVPAPLVQAPKREALDPSSGRKFPASGRVPRRRRQSSVPHGFAAEMVAGSHYGWVAFNGTDWFPFSPIGERTLHFSHWPAFGQGSGAAETASRVPPLRPVIPTAPRRPSSPCASPYRQAPDLPPPAGRSG